MFLFGTDEDRYDAGCSGAVMQAIEVFDGESLRTDLRQIHSAISRGVHVARADQFIDDGQRVRVVSGPLAGQTGVLLYRKGTCRLVLSLTFIRQGAVIEMDRCMVEAA